MYKYKITDQCKTLDCSNHVRVHGYCMVCYNRIYNKKKEILDAEFF